MGRDKFTHFLFTRFNSPIVYIPDRKPTATRVLEKSNKVQLSELWLDRRIRFFKKYCLPSVKNQSTDNFHWVIFVHKDTPTKYFYELKERALVVPTLESDFETAKKVIEAFQNRILKSSFVITSNLDSDDAISRTFIETIQQNFRSQEEILNIPFGYLVNGYETNTPEFLGREALQNPFRSFVEKNEDLKTLYYVTHGLSSKLAPVRQIRDTKATWLQVIHGDNLANRMKKRANDKMEPFSTISGEFGII